MPIHELHLKNLGPFDEIEFEFDPQVNVFVGPNNTGKSTVLLAVAQAVVARFFFPRKLCRSRETEIEVRGEIDGVSIRCSGPIPGPAFGMDDKKPFYPLLDKVGFGCLIPALRSSTDYRAEAAVGKRPAGSGFKLAESDALTQPNASMVRDEAIIQKIINLDYRSYRERNPAVRQALDKIAELASEITEGFPIQFAGVAEDKDGLYPQFETPDGKVPLNVLSQGTQSIIQWLGLLLIGYAERYDFPETLDDKPGVVIIDEIDAHMHPSWQRRILPTLSRSFPSLQIFCSSHSPFVLAGLKAGQAQLLKRDAKGKVTVSRNPTDLIGWSMDEILRNFLDVTNPTDLQTAENIERLQELRGKSRLTKKQKEELEQLRETLGRDLLAGSPEGEVERLAEKLRSAAADSNGPRKRAPAKKTAKKTKSSSSRTRRTKATRK